MSDDLKNILSHLNPDTEQDKLLLYLNRNMSDAEQHEFEKAMNDDAFMNDAVEGLEQVDNKKNIQDIVQQLNTDLKKQINKKKKRKEKRRIKDQPWILYSIILILLLLLVSYLVIKNMS